MFAWVHRHNARRMHSIIGHRHLAPVPRHRPGPRPQRGAVRRADVATVIIANDDAARAKAIIERYAWRMTIEQLLAEAIRAFHLDALAGAVALSIDFDVVVTVLADAVFAALARRIPGYHDATPDTLPRRFVETAGTIHPGDDTVTRPTRTNAPTLPACVPPTYPTSRCPGGGTDTALPNRPNRGRIRCVRIGAK